MIEFKQLEEQKVESIRKTLTEYGIKWKTVTTSSGLINMDIKSKDAIVKKTNKETLVLFNGKCYIRLMNNEYTEIVMK